MNTRNGTDVDAANAMEVFSNLGYKVKVHNDQTVEQLRQLLISGESEAESVPFNTELTFVTVMSHVFLGFFSAAKEDHSCCASFVCVLLSHGDEGVFYGTDGFIELKYLTSLFRGDRCKSLVGKPKLFFIQVLLCVLLHKVPCLVFFFLHFPYSSFMCSRPSFCMYRLGLQRQRSGWRHWNRQRRRQRHHQDPSGSWLPLCFLYSPG